MGAWIVWLVLAAVLGVAEVLTTTLALGLIAAGAVVTNDMYFSWVARSRPVSGVGQMITVSVCGYPAAVPRTYLGVT